MFVVLLLFIFVSQVEVLPLQENEVEPSRFLNDEEKPPMYNKDLFQGDILGIHSYSDRSSIVDPHQLWPEGKVFYTLTSTAPVFVDVVKEAFQEIENHTCIRFFERPPEVVDYIKINNVNGCNANIGKTGGSQDVNLGVGCNVKPIVLHELLHTLGFYHEQCRYDRDDYVEIIWDNIAEINHHNFEKTDMYDNNLLDEKFDYTSIMMYEWNAMAINYSLPTIVPKQPGIDLPPTWDKAGFSPADIRKINKLYECFGQKRPDPPRVPDFVCDFEHNDCEIINQENMGAYFHRIHEIVGDRQGYFLVVESELVDSPYTRLVTPYFKVHGRDETCVSLDYFLEGEGALDLEISQQGGGRTFDISYIERSQPEWFHLDVPLNTTGVREVRFFIEVTLKRGAPGIAAIDNFVFRRTPCPDLI